LKTENREENRNSKRMGILEKRLGTGISIIVIGIIFLFVPLNIFGYCLGILAGLGISEVLGMKKGTKRTLIPLAFIVYLCFSLWLFYCLRSSDKGILWIMLPLIAAGTFDPTAYFTGKLWGRSKIIPSISPNKTKLGTFCGALVCFVVVFIVGRAYLSLNYYQAVLMGLLLPACAFFGDLVESLFKRKMAAKDSGVILQGHGGILDRIDSPLLTVIGVFVLKYLFSII